MFALIYTNKGEEFLIGIYSDTEEAKMALWEHHESDMIEGEEAGEFDGFDKKQMLEAYDKNLKKYKIIRSQEKAA